MDDFASAMRAHWPQPGPGDDKYSRGVVGVVAGSEAYPGAAALVVAAAVRAGAGMVRYVGPRRAQDLVLHRRPEAVVHDPFEAADRLPRASAWIVGPGVADHPGQDAVIGAVLAAGTPLVVDAGALNACVRSRAAGARTVPGSHILLTPHERELQRALAAIRHDVTDHDIERDRAGHARLLAETARATVLLKGSETIIAVPGGDTTTLPLAPPSLATAGSGDVLAGIAGMLLAAGLDAPTAGALAAQVHAHAASMRPGPLAALDIAEALPRAIAEALGD